MVKITSKEPISFRVNGNLVLEISSKGCLATKEDALFAQSRLGDQIVITEVPAGKAETKVEEKKADEKKADEKPEEKKADEDKKPEEKAPEADAAGSDKSGDTGKPAGRTKASTK